MIYETKAGRFRWETQWGGADLPAFRGPIAGISTDANDQVYVLTRTKPAILIFDRDGRLLETWDDASFLRPHALLSLGEEGFLVVDDAAHAVFWFDQHKRIRHVFGEPGVPSDTGCVHKDYRTIQRAAAPFCFPTGAAVGKEGALYFSDGYGNARVHRFAPDGVLLGSFGQPGDGPGQFRLPHGILYSKERLYVADRQNHRVQLFAPDGSFLAEWNDLSRPAAIVHAPDGLFYVAECVHRHRFDHGVSRVSILSEDGEIVDRITSPAAEETAPGYHTAHAIAVDSLGSLYIGEVGKDWPEGYSGLIKLKRVD